MIFHPLLLAFLVSLISRTQQAKAFIFRQRQTRAPFPINFTASKRHAQIAPNNRRHCQSTSKDKSPETSSSPSQETDFTHEDIEWILRCCMPESPTTAEARIRYPVPFIEHPIPRDGKVTLEAWIQQGEDRVKVGRFGLTVTAGPPHPALFETIQNLQTNNPDLEYGTAAAIIYMFVEEDYRKRGLGTLALQVISWIHAKIDCGYTLLVTDDNGSGKLVTWYEDHGFTKAPLLQELMGSPNGMYGLTMIAPATLGQLPGDFELIQKEE